MMQRRILLGKAIVISGLLFLCSPARATMAKSVVYVYEGEGVSSTALLMLMASLQEAVDHSKHGIKLISPQEVKQGMWRDDAALIAFGGGFDLGFIQALGDQGQAHVRDYVRLGGSYLGFCAGGYFGADYIEFDKGGPDEVVGPRQLKFFPGTCVGPVFPGFDYQSEKGTRAALVSWEASPDIQDFHVYFNGGGQFEPTEPEAALDKVMASPPKDKPSPDRQRSRNSVEALFDMQVPRWMVLSRYLDIPEAPIAAVRAHVGLGKALLTGIHPEFIPSRLNSQDPYLKDIVPALQASDVTRRKAMVAMLDLLGLKTIAPKL